MLLRWKRETSPPVTKVVLPSIGRFIAAFSALSSSALLAPAGRLTAPLAIALSSSAWLSASERRARLSVPMVCETWIFSAMRGVTSMVTLCELWTTVLPLTISVSVDWSVASTRRLRSTVSVVLSGAPPPSPLTDWVSIRSTWSPGKMKPATPVLSETGMVTARIPGPSAAARKPRSCGATSAPLVSGWPAVTG